MSHSIRPGELLICVLCVRVIQGFLKLQKVNSANFNEALRHRLVSVLSGIEKDFDVQWICVTQSTNDDLKARVASTETPVHAVLVADEQTKGRGTRGRSWQSPAVSTLLSVAFPLEENTIPAGLSLLVGESCVRHLWEINGTVRLKWPNDILIDGGKAGGILCETRRNRAGVLHAVVGIGINIALEEGFAVPKGIRPAALLIANPGDERDEVRVRTAALLIKAVLEVVRRDCREALESLSCRWNEVDAFAGKRVVVEASSGGIVQGEVCGITGCGELLIRTDAGEKKFISVRIRELIET